MPLTTIRTVGKADVDERFEFVTKSKFNTGDEVSLKSEKPIVSQVYGVAKVIGYLGPGRDQSHRRYQAVRVY